MESLSNLLDKTPLIEKIIVFCASDAGWWSLLGLMGVLCILYVHFSVVREKDEEMRSSVFVKNLTRIAFFMIILAISCFALITAGYHFAEKTFNETITKTTARFSNEILSKDEYIKELQNEIASQDAIINRQQNILREQDKALTNKK